MSGDIINKKVTEQQYNNTPFLKDEQNNLRIVHKSNKKRYFG